MLCKALKFQNIFKHYLSKKYCQIETGNFQVEQKYAGFNVKSKLT